MVFKWIMNGLKDNKKQKKPSPLRDYDLKGLWRILFWRNGRDLNPRPPA